MSAALPRLGVTAYSFTPVYHGLRYSFEELIREIGRRGLGPGLEIVGFQSIRDFPRISADFAARFRDLLAETGLEPSCLALNGDAGIHAGRLLDDREMADYLEPQIQAAVTLGFPAVRLQKTTSAGAVERLIPLAEEHGIKLAYEIHSPDTVRSDWVLALRELADRRDTRLLGFAPDWGASVRQPHPSLWRSFRQKGVPEQVIEGVAQRWHEVGALPELPEEGELMKEFIGLASSLGGGEAATGLAIYAVGIFGHQDPQAWREIAPRILHVHGKFFGIDDSGEEPAVPHDELLGLLVDVGYTGYISSEWEGWHWDSSPDPFEMVEAHHRLSRAVLDRHASALSAGPLSSEATR
jgi:hypothetical protein